MIFEFVTVSKIGKQPIKIPEGVEVKIDGTLIVVKGPKGELRYEANNEIKIEVKDRKIITSVDRKTKKASALWGLVRALIFNMVKGVSEGFEKRLEIQGIGYKAIVSGRKLILSLGFSHPIEIEPPDGIDFKVDKNIITVSGINKQLVGQVAADIRALRKPEPYKGKGIRYVGEVVRRKAGKKTVATEK